MAVLSPFDPAEQLPGATGAPILPVAPQPPPGAPMAPQLPDVDPLTGLPAAPPPAEPQGYQFDTQGEPLPWPPDSFFDGMPGAQGYTGHDVPEVPNDQAPPAPPATAEAGAQGMAALDQARADGHTVAAPEAGKNAPAAPAPSTGDPYLDTLYRGEDAKARAAVEQGEAEKTKNLYLSEEGSRAAQDRAARTAAAEKEYRDVYTEARAHRAQLDQEAQAIASQKTDPRRVWNNMSFGAQLATGIAAALVGATTQSIKSGHNSVLDAIDKQVEQDLQAQQADLDNRWKSNTVRRGLLADDLAAGRDMLDVQYKALNVAYDTAMDHAKSYALRFDNPVIDARTNTFIADALERKAQLAHDMQTQKEKQIYDRRQKAFDNALELRKQKFVETNAEANRQNALELAGMRGQGKVSAQEAAAHKEQESLILDPHGDPIPDGKGGFAHASGPTEAGKARENFGAKWLLYKHVDDYTKAVEEAGRGFAGWGPAAKSDKMAELQAMHANLVTEFNEAKDLKRLSAEDIHLVGGDIIPEPSSLMHGSNPAPAARKARSMFRDQLNNEMQTQWGVHDKDWVGTYETAHPEEFKPNATEAAGNQQGKTFERGYFIDDNGQINRDGRGKTISEDDYNYYLRERAKEEGLIKRPPPSTHAPSADEEMDRMYGTHQAGK